jgi:hypothetical protein
MNDKPHPPASLQSRCAAGFWAASLLFFILYSAPHSVHHFFEQHSAATHDDSANHHGTDQPNKSTNNSDCVFQISASRCTFGLTAQPQSFSPIDLVQALIIYGSPRRSPRFFSSPFPIRAPPQI